MIRTIRRFLTSALLGLLLLTAACASSDTVTLIIGTPPGPTATAVASPTPSLAATMVPDSTPAPTLTPTTTALPPADSEPSPTPVRPGWETETRSFTSPDGRWTAEVTVALPIADGAVVSDQYYTLQTITSVDGNTQWTVVDQWQPWGLGYTVPDPLQWSRDGNVLFWTNRPVPDGCSPFTNGSDLLQVDLNDGTVTELVPAVGLVLSLSPDEATLAYVRGSELALRDLASGQDQVIDLAEIADGSPGRIVWSPDASKLMLTVAANACGPLEERQHAIVRVEADTLAADVLVEADDRLLTTAAWPEDQVILFDKDGQQWRLDPESGTLMAAPGSQEPAEGEDAGDQETTPTPLTDLDEEPARVNTLTVSTAEDRPGPGDAVTLTWEAVGNTASLCVEYAGRYYDGCGDVEVSGDFTYTLRSEEPVADHWADFTLTVSSLTSSDRATTRLPVRCYHDWFQDSVSTEWCPNEPPRSHQAVGQAFERGWIIRTDLNTAYVLFDEPGNPYRAYGLLPPLPLEPPGDDSATRGTAVATALVPLWSGSLAGMQDLKDRLGLPVEDAVYYELLTQCAHTPEPNPPCYVLGPDGQVFSTQLARAAGPGEDGITTASGTFAWMEQP